MTASGQDSHLAANGAGPFDGPGEMRALCRALDWAATSLGPVEGWPQSLRTTAQMALAQPFPTVLLWGPELAQLYNDGYRALTGVKHPAGLGQPMKECWPEVWQLNEPIYARVRAGESLLVEDASYPITGSGALEDACFTLGYSPLRDEAGGVVGVLVVVHETTGRRRAEAALRASEARHAFLLGLSDALRPLADPVEIEEVTARFLGEHLGADRVCYAEIDPANGRALVLRDYCRREEARSIVGQHEFTSYRTIAEMAPAGLRLVEPDVAHSTRLLPEEKEAFLAFGIGALVVLPLMRSGRMTAMLLVTAERSRAWTDCDLEVIEAAAERTRAGVERARAERLLRETSERLQDALATARMAYWEWDPASGRTVGSASLAEVFGLPPGDTFDISALGFTLVHPEDRERLQALVEDAGAGGRGWHAEFRVVRPSDGRVASLEERATAVRDPVTGETRMTALVWDVSDRKLAEAASEHARRERELNARRRQLAEAEENERRRLARELHDEVGQHLSALGLGLQALSDVVPPGSEVDRRAADLRRLADVLGRELHTVAVQLRPRALDDFGLEAALTSLGADWSDRAAIQLDLHTRLGDDRMPDAVESAIYRVVQEALTNVARHSGASRASVIVERQDGTAVAIVEDDGCGFETAHLGTAGSGERLGLLGIRERVALLGGTAEVESASGAGTTVFVRIPLDGTMDGATPPDSPDDRHGTAREAAEGRAGR